MEMTDDAFARTAVLSFERHALRGDSFPVEIALDGAVRNAKERGGASSNGFSPKRDR